MRRLLIQVSVFTLLVAATFIGILSLADGHTDAFYVRYTTPRQDNLVLGTSRAAQAIQPAALSSVLDRPFFNYGFTVRTSPFGAAYLKSVRKKLNPDQENGIFILEVNPWSISSRTEDPNDSLNFREVGMSIATTENVNISPNFKYLTDNLGGKFYRILYNHSPIFLHDDGWLEVTVPMDSLAVRRRMEVRLRKYRKENLPYFKFSSLRSDYLLRTIRYLKEHGSVYLVRLPVHDSILAIDTESMPDFREKMHGAIALADGYLDMTGNNEGYLFNDGSHLHKESGRVVSEKIAIWIRELQLAGNGTAARTDTLH